MVIEAGATTHVGSALVSVTGRPPVGAAIATPWLSNRISIVSVKGLPNEIEFTWISSSAVTDTTETMEPNWGFETDTFAVPGSRPRSVAFDDWAPSMMKTVDTVGVVIVSSSETIERSTPPVGAGSDRVMGSEAVPPKGTFRVAGVVYSATVIRMVSATVPPSESVTVALMRWTPVVN